MGRPLTLDFAHDQPAIVLRSVRAGWWLLALSLAAAAALGTWYVSLSQHAERLDRELQHLRRLATQPLAGAVTASPALVNEIRAANAVIERLNRPWFELFRGVESARDDRVRILSMQPNAERSQFALTGEAESFAAITELLEALGRSPGLGPVRVVRHELRAQDVIHFEALGQWQTSR